MKISEKVVTCRGRIGQIPGDAVRPLIAIRSAAAAANLTAADCLPGPIKGASPTGDTAPLDMQAFSPELASTFRIQDGQHRMLAITRLKSFLSKQARRNGGFAEAKGRS